MLASPVQGLQEAERYPLKIEATKIEIRPAAPEANASCSAAQDATAAEEPVKQDGHDLILAMIPRLDWEVLLGAVAALGGESSLHLSCPLPDEAGLALRFALALPSTLCDLLARYGAYFLCSRQWAWGGGWGRASTLDWRAGERDMVP